MYPFVRFAAELVRSRAHAPLAPGAAHVTSVTCLPWDLDFQLEMNNGRILTLFDLGRFGLLTRMGAIQALRQKGWYGTIAGSTIRYRRRITVFQRLEVRSRMIGSDDRFTYFEQGLWRGEDCAAHAVLRIAITTGKGIIPPADVAAAMGIDPDQFNLPEWVRAWAEAEAARPWPPMHD